MRGQGIVTTLAMGVLFLALFCYGKPTAGAPQPGSTFIPEQREPQKIAIQGIIAYMAAEGGYYIKGQGQTSDIFAIANQNPVVLDELAKSGKVVTIEEGIRRTI